MPTTPQNDAGFTIESQEYLVYINDIFVSKVINVIQTKVVGKNVNNGISVIGVNVKFNPKEVLKKLSLSPIELATSPGKIRLKVDVKLKVKFWIFTINIPYMYESTIKELTTPTKVE